jgi:hypothetical protein
MENFMIPSINPEQFHKFWANCSTCGFQASLGREVLQHRYIMCRIPILFSDIKQNTFPCYKWVSHPTNPDDPDTFVLSHTDWALKMS